MMKKILSFFLLGFIFSLSACGTGHSQDISFDGKIFVLETNGQTYVKTASVELPDFYLGGNIKASYIENIDQNTGFQSDFLSSFLFVQHSLSSSVDLNSFYTANREELQKHLENIKSINLNDTYFFCGDRQVSSISHDFDFYVQLWDKSFYVTQYFYLENNVGTVISFVSNDEVERKNFSRSLHSFVCGG